MSFLQNCKTFRKLMTNDCIMVPGAFNGMSARIAAENGKHTFHNNNDILLQYSHSRFDYIRNIKAIVGLNLPKLLTINRFQISLHFWCCCHCLNWCS